MQLNKQLVILQEEVRLNRLLELQWLDIQLEILREDMQVQKYQASIIRIE